MVKSTNLGPDDFKSFSNTSSMLEFVTSPAGQNLTQSIIYFTSFEQVIKYRLMYNGTVNFDLYENQVEEPFILPQLQLALDRAIISTFVTKSPVIQVLTKPWPSPPSFSFNSTFPISNIKIGYLGFGFFGAGLISLALALFWVICLYLIVQEKDQQLRWAMTMMGMKSSSYWASWMTSNLIFLILSIVLTHLTGYLVGIPWFTHCDPFVVIILLTSYGFSLTALGFLISTLTATPRNAMIIAFLINAIGFLANTLLTSPLFIYSIYATFPFVSYILMFYPSYNFAKAFADISYEVFLSRWFPPHFAIGELGYFHFKLLFDHPMVIKEAFKDIPSPYLSIIHLWWNTILYVILAIYLDNILPSNNGIKRSPWFFLLPSFWGCRSKTNIEEKIKFHKQTQHQDSDGISDENVIKEKDLALSHQLDDKENIRILRIEKNFSHGSNHIKALKGVCLTASKGTCLSILGPNGAGKTTLISIMCGLLDPSNGDAFIFGRDIKTDISEIRSFIGVCPQKDLFWSELTGYEHMLLFAALKGVPILQLHSQIKDILTQVKLWDVKHKYVETYSGGMKRRLSVALSMIGDPEICFLDEPTTGLDPKSKRDVWKMIENLKKNRLVILTTHSMEESDALSDKIAIMAFGNVVCVGDSLYLKNTYGNGYSLSLTIAEGDFDQVHQAVLGDVPSAKLISSNSGSLLYNIPGNVDVKNGIIPALESIENSKLIRDWGISQTTLEEVYLTVTKKHKFGYGKDQVSV